MSGAQHFLTCSTRSSCHRGLQLRSKCAIAAPSLAHQPAWSPQVAEVRRPAVAMISGIIRHSMTAATNERMAACMLSMCRVREQAPSPSSNGLALVLIDCTQHAACTSSDAQPTSQVLGQLCHASALSGWASAGYIAWQHAMQATNVVTMGCYRSQPTIAAPHLNHGPACLAGASDNASRVHKCTDGPCTAAVRRPLRLCSGRHCR